MKERCIMRPMCGIQFTYRKKVKCIMLMFGFIEKINLLAIGCGVHCCGLCVMNKDRHVLGNALVFEVMPKGKRIERGKLRKKA